MSRAEQVEGSTSHQNCSSPWPALILCALTIKPLRPGSWGLMAGECQIMFVASSIVAPHITSGRLRALAVTTAKRSILAPGLPPISATLPGYESSAFTVMVAPARTPRAITTRLNQEVVRLLNQTDTKQKVLSIGVEAGRSPEQYGRRAYCCNKSRNY
jgi:hypothetical protein